MSESEIVKNKLLKLIGKKRRYSDIDKSINTKYSNKCKSNFLKLKFLIDDCDNNKEINEFQN